MGTQWIFINVIRYALCQWVIRLPKVVVARRMACAAQRMRRDYEAYPGLGVVDIANELKAKAENI